MPPLPSASINGSPAGKSWSRWRSHSSGDSAFAAGSLEIALQVLNRAVKLGLIGSLLASDTFDFFSLLGNLGLGTVSLDDDELEDGLSKGYSVVFELAGIEPGSSSGTFLNVNCSTEFFRADFHKTFKANDADDHAIDSAFAALTALERLEDAIKGAHNVLDGVRPSQGADLVVVRELVLAFYASEGASLVRGIHECMQLTHKSGGNTKDLVKTALKPLLATMTAEVKNL